ncbi:hypothetical protein P0D75_18415 [Paraburkholderia sediminicola]|uniref:hypothetical protein n=1 Tax=Paraburkholderia sediminicola TaxID=458836 RepID=UPI0038B89DAF
MLAGKKRGASMKFDGWQIPLATIAGVIGASAYFYHPADSSEAVAAWVQAIGSIGAILAAVWVAHRQYEQTRKLEIDRAAADAAKDEAETKAFVQSVRQELMTIWEGYSTGIRPALLAVGEGAIFGMFVPASTDAFTIYNNASPRVGKVSDDELRRLIVATYARAKGHIYSMQLNNGLLTDCNNFALMHRGEHHDEILARKRAALENYAVQLKQRDAELEQHLQAFLVRAGDWLPA